MERAQRDLFIAVAIIAIAHHQGEQRWPTVWCIGEVATGKWLCLGRKLALGKAAEIYLGKTVEFETAKRAARRVFSATEVDGKQRTAIAFVEAAERIAAATDKSLGVAVAARFVKLIIAIDKPVDNLVATVN